MKRKLGLKETVLRKFITGLATLLPTIITIFIIVKVVEFTTDNIGVYVVQALAAIINSVGAYPSDDPFKFDYPSLSGFFLALAIIYFLGLFLATFVGRKIWGFFERRVEKLPLVNFIYPSVRRITKFLFGSEEDAESGYKGVVALQYPRKGIYSIGFVTGEGLEAIEEKEQREFVTVFMPSSPTPMTGYVITVPKDEIIELPFKVEQVFRYIMSAGVVGPHVEVEEDLIGAQLEMKEAEKKIAPPEDASDEKRDSEKSA